MKLITIAILASAAFLTACADPSTNRPKAVVSEPATSTGTNTVTPSNLPQLDFKAQGTALPFGPETSTIEFLGSKVTGQHDGGFQKFRGVIDLVDDKVESSRVFVEIDMSTVYTDVADLTKHLLTPDFFDVAKFPKATFLSSKIVPDTAKGADNYTVTGDLEMHGVKKTITFPATIKAAPDKISVDAEFSINRKDFGIVYAGKADDLIRDGVVLILDIAAPRK